MNAKLKRIQSDCQYKGKWPYPKDYPKTQMYLDIKYLLGLCKQLHEENVKLKIQNEKLAENLERFGQEPEPVIARPGSEQETKILSHEP